MSENPTVCPKKVLRLINNRTTAFCYILKISFVSDSVILHLIFENRTKIKRVTRVRRPKAVNHETSELFDFGCYMGA